MPCTFVSLVTIGFPHTEHTCSHAHFSRESNHIITTCYCINGSIHWHQLLINKIASIIEAILCII